jgi:hypothetical protein
MQILRDFICMVVSVPGQFPPHQLVGDALVPIIEEVWEISFRNFPLEFSSEFIPLLAWVFPRAQLALDDLHGDALRCKLFLVLL